MNSMFFSTRFWHVFSNISVYLNLPQAWYNDSDLMSRLMLFRTVECRTESILSWWWRGYILWMNVTCDHWAVSGGAGRTRWPSRQPRVETGLPGPGWAQSWVTFVFSSRPWKVLAEFAGSGWVQGYITHCRVSWGNENKRDDELSLFFYYSFYFWSSSSS